MQPPLSAGITLQNRYRLLGVLGQGGFGRTYLGEDLGRFNERCALKEYIPPPSGEYALQKSKELFQREAAILYQIQHPQIPQFRATFEENQRLFLVQDYVEGKTYRDLLNERKAQGMVFAEAEVQQLMRQLLPVLAHIHARGIIHRDIAPDNVILRQVDYLPVLIDFGVVKEIATRMQSPADSVTHSTTVGKLGYAPSEQMQTGRAYPSSDLYALAVTAVVLLTGREPQELFDDVSLTWHWQRFAPVSPGFAAVLDKMLNYRPGDRYQSVAEVAQALQAALHPTTPPPTAPPTLNPQPTNPFAVSPLPPYSQSPPAQPQPANPDLSQMRTVAIGRTPNPTTANTPYPANTPPTQNFQPAPPARDPSVWDNPWAVLAIGTGLAVVTGIGSWAVVSALYGTRSTPTPTPTPTLTTPPTPTPVPTATAPPTPTPTPTPTPEQPVEFEQRLDLVAGSSTAAQGNLRSNQTINYRVAMQAGETLTAALEGEGVLLTVLGPDGQPIADDARRTLRWSGVAPASGDYTIQIRPVQGVPQADYVLNVSLEAPQPTPTPTPEPTPTPAPDPGDIQVETEYLQLAAGETSREVDNQVRPGLIRRYLVEVGTDQRLEVALLQGGATLTFRYPDGQVVEGAGSTGLDLGPGLPQSGFYQIDVTADQVVNFALRVTVTTP